MKKKHYLAALVLLIFSSGASANTMYNTLVLWKINNERVNILLDKCPKITFMANEMIISTTDNTISFPTNEIKKFTHESLPSSVKNPVDTQNFKLFLSNSTLQISHLSGNSPVSIYGTDGRLLLSTQTDAKGNATIDLNGLQVGIYIISTKSGNFKISRK